MKFLKYTITVLRNKYLLCLTAFAIWLLFFDRNDFFAQMERRRELREIRESKDYFTKRITEDRKFSKDLQFNAAAVEKYAREKYLMKKDNEDLFIIQPLKTSN
jgi:cell division protein DivIC